MRLAWVLAGLSIVNAEHLEKRGVTNGIAGGGLQICNGTPVRLHVALTQVGPLYYENWLGAGECMTRNGIGNVWFSIEAKIGTSDNEYNDRQVAMPIVGMVATALALVCPAAAWGAGNAVRLVASSASRGMLGRALMSNPYSVRAVTAIATRASLIRRYAGVTGVVAGSTGTVLDLNAIVSRMEDSWSGFYANCKSWLITSEMSFLEAKGHIYPALDMPSSFSLKPMGHYDCHSGHSDTVEVDRSRVDRISDHVLAMVDDVCD